MKKTPRAQAEQEVGPPKASWGHRQLGDERPELHCPLGLVGVQSIRLRPPEPSSLESAASPRRVGGLGLRWGGLRPPPRPLGRLPSPFSTVPEPWSPFPVTARKGPLLRRGNSTVPRPPLLPDGPTRCPSPGQHGVPLRGPGPLPTFLGRTSPRPPLGGGPVASEHRNPSLSPVLFVAAPLSLA